MVVFLPKLAEKSLFLFFLLLLCGRALSMTFAVTADGGKRLYSGVPDSRDYYVSPSEDDGTTPGAYIREENLLQMVLWKTVHFALFLVKISINFSPGYSTVFFFITVYVSTLQ
jgi:hypothetical protein